MVSTKAAFSEYGRLFDLNANAGDGQKDQQIVGVNPLSPPLRSLLQRPQGHPAKSKFLAISSVKLDWIAKELHMGVRSGVTRAEQMLKTKLINNRQVKRMWKKMEKMHHFYA